MFRIKSVVINIFKKKQRILTFTFDDVPVCTYLNGVVSILNPLDIKATFYIAKYFDLYECFDAGLIKELHEVGHEIGNHTLTHVNFDEIAQNEDLIKKEVLENQEFIKNLIGVTPKSFSYPYGIGHENKILIRLLTKLNLCARGIKEDINGLPPKDWLSLDAVQMYEKKHQENFIPKMIEHIDNLKARRSGWLIFYTHDIQDNYSEYGCSPFGFKAIAEYAKKLEKNQEIKIKTIAEVKSEY